MNFDDYSLEELREMEALTDRIVENMKQIKQIDNQLDLETLDKQTDSIRFVLA